MDDKTVPSVVYPSRHYTHLAHCDCACAFEPAPSPAPEPGTGLWVRQRDALSMPLERGWRAYFNPSGPVGVAALSPAAQRLLASFDSPAPVNGNHATGWTGMSAAGTASAIKDLIAVGLLQAVDGEPRPQPAPLTLSAWLHLIEACNLACPYCYVEKKSRTMSAEVGRRAVDRLVDAARRYDYRRLRLKYAGGEPTLNPGLVQTIHHYAARQTAAAGLELEEVLLTNGAGVDDGVLDGLVQAGLELMVSLDGGPAAHDRLRPRHGGRGSYAAVTGFVNRALARGLQPDISITVTALNLDGVPEAAGFALERGLPFNLNFYRACPPAGTLRQPDPLAPSPDRLVEAILKVFERVRQQADYAWPLSGILDRVRLDLPHDYVCSAGRDYLVVDTTGRVSACQMLLDTPWSDLAEDDPLANIRQRGEGLFRAAAELPTCRDCLWRPACAGGCPLTRGTALHAAYCQAYRALLPELIKLEGERLARRQPPPEHPACQAIQTAL